MGNEDLFQQYIDDWVATHNQQEPDWPSAAVAMGVSESSYLTDLFRAAVLDDGMLEDRIRSALQVLDD